MRSLHNSPTNPATKNVPDIQKFGNPDGWQLVCKASSEKEQWMRSTKAFNLPNGVLIQTSTIDGGTPAESVVFVPGINYLKNNVGEEGFQKI